MQLWRLILYNCFEKSLHSVEVGGVQLTLNPQVGTKLKGAIKESVQLWRVKLWRFDCN